MLDLMQPSQLITRMYLESLPFTTPKYERYFSDFRYQQTMQLLKEGVYSFTKYNQVLSMVPRSSSTVPFTAEDYLPILPLLYGKVSCKN
jgi:hypothetical protein